MREHIEKLCLQRILQQPGDNPNFCQTRFHQRNGAHLGVFCPWLEATLLQNWLLDQVWCHHGNKALGNSLLHRVVAQSHLQEGCSSLQVHKLPSAHTGACLEVQEIQVIAELQVILWGERETGSLATFPQDPGLVFAAYWGLRAQPTIRGCSMPQWEADLRTGRIIPSFTAQSWTWGNLI